MHKKFDLLTVSNGQRSPIRLKLIHVGRISHSSRLVKTAFENSLPFSSSTVDIGTHPPTHTQTHQGIPNKVSISKP